ncbi:MAG: acireductone synthase [Beijerinckiaceae bacterium]|nr:acireductone synthase [Beijerinckiaceae bacterium]
MLPLSASAVLLDIEGTISPQAFVSQVMFPYARAHLATFVARKAEDETVMRLLAEAREQAGGDPIAAMLAWMDEDRKEPTLKAMQGLVWEEAYRDGAFKGRIFPDALAALRRWKAAGLPAHIYSSGSVQAQMQFFEFNEDGDLRPLFQMHFDTATGSKLEHGSYLRIADAIGANPAGIAFFSDNERELIAAEEAGLQALHVFRDGMAPSKRFKAIGSFDQVEINPTG